MKKIFGLQVAHSSSNLSGEIHEDHLVDLVPVAGAEIVQQVSTGHELCHDVEGWLTCTHSQQLK